MVLAQVSPLSRMFAISGVLLAVAVAAHVAPRPARLVLHTEWRADSLYLSAWRRGPVVAPLDGPELVPLKFTTFGTGGDGCRWLGTETLTPIGPKRYAYRYEETILECVPGATPYEKTPRVGCVTVED